ncbi:MAG: hypothetical protein R3213_08490 [Flavobacteriaceae bacterium]|nr:hypothetical protein [Flavobacteriaceae bacterium]
MAKTKTKVGLFVIQKAQDGEWDTKLDRTLEFKNQEAAAEFCANNNDSIDDDDDWYIYAEIL